MVAEAYQDDVAFQMYDATRGNRTIRVVEQLTVRGGKITSSIFVADMAAFATFVGDLTGTEGYGPRMNRNPEVGRWFDQADRPPRRDDAARPRHHPGGRWPRHRGHQVEDADLRLPRQHR
jgi:hypothetical protein